MGLVDHLRGDGQRTRRRSRLHRRLQPHTAEATRLRLRGAGRRPERPTADHASGALRARGGVVRPEGRDPLPHRGQLRVPLGLLPLHPEEEPDEDRAGSTTMAGCRCSPSRASRTPTSRRGSRTGPSTRSSGSTSTSPNPTFPYTPGQVAPTTNDAALVSSATRAAPRAPRSSRGSRARCTTTTSSTSPPPRAAARRRTTRTTTTPTASARGNGQVWAYHTRAKTLQVIYQAPVDPVEANLTFDFPDNITTSRRGTLVVCEDSTVDNYIRGLTRGGKLWDIALNRLVSQLDRPAAVRRRVRRVDILAGTGTRCSSTSRPAAACHSRSGGRGTASASDLAAPPHPRDWWRPGLPRGRHSDRGQGMRLGESSAAGRRTPPSWSTASPGCGTRCRSTSWC